MRDEKFFRPSSLPSSLRGGATEITSISSSIISQVPDGKAEHTFTFGLLDAGPFESQPDQVASELLKSGAARVTRSGDGRPTHLCFAGDVVVEVKLEVCTKDVRELCGVVASAVARAPGVAAKAVARG